MMELKSEIQSGGPSSTKADLNFGTGNLARSQNNPTVREAEFNLSADEELRHFRVFAEQNRLKITRDECNDPVIQGRYGNLSPVGHKIMACLLDKETAHAKKKLLKLCQGDADDVVAGLDHQQEWDWILSVKEPVCTVEGDTEAIFVFHPSDKEFLELCLHHLGIKRKRHLSTATVQRLRQQGFQTAKNRAEVPL